MSQNCPLDRKDGSRLVSDRKQCDWNLLRAAESCPHTTVLGENACYGSRDFALPS